MERITEFLIRRFVKNYQQTNDSQVRKAYGFLSGGAGICVNLLLCTMKLIAGYISGSVGIIGDGINNLSDAGSSVVTMLGMKMSAKPADADHPYGHGRIEYLVAMVIAGVIVLVGAELAVTSVVKLLNPEPVEVSLAALGVMFFSVAGKMWLGAFNEALAEKTDSPVFYAVAADSRSDCYATAAVIICLVIYSFKGYNLDAAAGIIVGCFIIYSGWQAAVETMQHILGKPTDPDFLQEIADIALEDERVLGVHDVMAHSYGASTIYASLHIEVPSTMRLVEAHAVANKLENKLAGKLQVQATVHVDPRLVGDPHFDALYTELQQILQEIDVHLTLHDLRIAHGNTLFFDVKASYNFALPVEDLQLWINNKLRDREIAYRAIIRLDRA